ncbi:hypothetical protein [Lactiplantibacillus plantarum]|uniref:hypothetical protein n=1 Tax=Lactiplantibacillus plantarum TaxID=1590 RepID=UPI00404589FB
MQITELLTPVYDAAWLPWAVQYFFLIGIAATAALTAAGAAFGEAGSPARRLLPAAVTVLLVCAIAAPVSLLADLHHLYLSRRDAGSVNFDTNSYAFGNLGGQSLTIGGGTNLSIGASMSGAALTINTDTAITANAINTGSGSVSLTSRYANTDLAPTTACWRRSSSRSSNSRSAASSCWAMPSAAASAR